MCVWLRVPCGHVFFFCPAFCLITPFCVQALLKEHANDNPKLSYTGKPIIKWPKRVSRVCFEAHGTFKA